MRPAGECSLLPLEVAAPIVGDGGGEAGLDLDVVVDLEGVHRRDCVGDRGRRDGAMRRSRGVAARGDPRCVYLADHGCYAPADDRWNNRRWHGARSGNNAPFDPTKGFLAAYLGKSRSVTACPLFTKMLGGTQSFEDGTGGSFESPAERLAGTNPHGGSAAAHDLGWFGPDEENGCWNPRRSNLVR